MSTYTDLFEESRNNKSPICIYTRNDESDTFSFGIILNYSEDCYIIASINKLCEVDGIRFGYINDIYRIESNGRYTDKYLKIRDIMNKDWDVSAYSNYFDNADCSINDFFEYAVNYHQVVSFSVVHTNIYNFTGFIDGFNDLIIKIDTLDDYGNIDGKSIVNIDDIDYCSCDSLDEQILKCLALIIKNKV